MQKADCEAALKAFDQEQPEAMNRLFAMLRIPSISTDPKYHFDCERAAEALSAELTELGFDAKVVPTGGKPMVVGQYRSAGTGKPHALFYGHYDVQPVDPLDEWDHDPFDPQVLEREDGSKYISGRGTSDDKCQLRTFLEACRAWVRSTGRIPCDLTVLLEGEEESGSPNMVPFLEAHRDELAADFALACDTTMWNADTPAITVSLRGSFTGEVILRAANRDLHSGVYGSAARNPITLLTQILGNLHDSSGRIMISEFYDAVREPSAELRNLWQNIDFDEEGFLSQIGLTVPAGESGRTVLEQTWSRPTAEINGIIGGYTGEGFKTVIPATARAKISFRLVADQNPRHIWNMFMRHVEERLPKDCEAEFREYGNSLPISLADTEAPLANCMSALQAEWLTDTVLMGSGGSIPIVAEFKKRLGLDTVLIGFALDSDRIHSPNEKYELRSFHKGGRSWVRILGELGSGWKRSRYSSP